MPGGLSHRAIGSNSGGDEELLDEAVYRRQLGQLESRSVLERRLRKVRTALKQPIMELVQKLKTLLSENFRR